MRLRDKVKKQARQKLGSYLRDAEHDINNNYIAGIDVLSKSMGLRVDYKPK
jgi:hypothetical protein